MEDNEQTVESTEVVPEREISEVSIRQALNKQFEHTKKDDSEDKPSEEPTKETSENAVAVQQPIQQERVPMVPPADMNQVERDAFLNPTSENSHILQSYLNRRAYETRSDYSRKMQEVEALKRQNQSIYEVVQQYQDDYARDGIAVQDAVRRSIAWDRAMKQNPMQTAREWLAAYGIQPEDLSNYQVNQTEYPEAEAQYLTRAEAERIAEERIQSVMYEQEKKALEYVNQSVVDSFISQKPLFRDPETASQLEAEMVPVVEALSKTGRYSSPDQILETAYNYVVNGNPTFSGLNQRLTAKPMLEQQQAITQKAKQAAKSISGSAGSGSPRVVTKDIRDNLRRRMAGE